MPAIATGPDALRVEVAAVEVDHLHLIGTLPGLVPQAVAARCGTGTGYLRGTGASGRAVAWKAPGSATWGPSETIAADGTVVLVDGDDTDKWIRISAHLSYLVRPGEAVVRLDDRYANGPPLDDVTAAEASAGDVTTYTLALTNDSTVTLTQVAAWLDASVSGLEVSADGATWSAPTTEATALALADIAAAGSTTLHLRRTITAGASADAGVLTLIHLAFSGL